MLRTTSCFITGANRGIGLEFVRQIINLDPKPINVIAACRNPDKAEELKKLTSVANNLHIVRLDVRDFSSYDKLSTEVNQIVGTKGLDLLINNAGVAAFKTLSQVSPKDMLESLEVNTVAPLILTKTLLPLIKASDAEKRSKLIVNISAIIGSISENNQGGMYPYRTSKAALNMITKSVAADLEKEGILCVSMHPGWVKTDMGGKNAPMKVDFSVSKMIKTLGSIDKNSNGKIINFDGKIIPW